ncbi:MAG: aldo/keto reductase [Neisseriaceae bacterium]
MNNNQKYINLGTNRLNISRIGLGCMGMSEFYGETDDNQSIKTIQKAHELGVNHFDTADIYGCGHNEKLLAKALKPFKREDYIIATKCGFIRNDSTQEIIGLDCSPKHIKKACDESLKRLEVDYIDLFYLHRKDPKLPIEDSMEGLTELVKEGKVLNIGICSVSPEAIQAAHNIHPLTAVQYEYSLMTRDVEVDILPLCKKLNIGLIAYSPTGGGFISGNIRSVDNLAPDDFRRMLPRLSYENIAHNLNIVAIIQDLASRKGCTAAQVALAWLLAQWDNLAVIPGTKRTSYLEDNLKANDVLFTPEEIEYLNTSIPFRCAKGPRLPKEILNLLNNYELPL